MFLSGTRFRGLQNIGSTKGKRISAFIIDETVIQIGIRQYWLWFVVNQYLVQYLGIYLSEERNMLIAKKFIRSLVEKYGKHTVYTDGGTWYPEAFIY